MCVYSQKLNTKKVLMFLLEKLWPEKKNARYGGGDYLLTLYIFDTQCLMFLMTIARDSWHLGIRLV